MGFKVASRVRGLSDEAFREAFGTKEQCRAALVRLRWPDGFVCPCCGHREHCVLAGRGLYQCNRCNKQTSPTAGTIFHATKLPLTLWFAAIHLVVTAKNGISSVELGRRLGVKQPTAWAVKHKIMAVMARREGETALTGRVEMDDAYLGGVRSGGKRGRGAAGKTPFVAAVSTSPEGRPRKLKLAPVKGFRKREIARGAKHWLAPGAAVVTDGRQHEGGHHHHHDGHHHDGHHHDGHHHDGHHHDEHHHGHPEFESEVLDAAGPVARAALENFFAGLPPEVLRAKGFMVVDGAASLVHFTVGQLEITPTTLDRVPQMVFIGRDLDQAELAECFAFAGAAPDGERS